MVNSRISCRFSAIYLLFYVPFSSWIKYPMDISYTHLFAFLISICSMVKRLALENILMSLLLKMKLLDTILKILKKIYSQVQLLSPSLHPLHWFPPCSFPNDYYLFLCLMFPFAHLMKLPHHLVLLSFGILSGASYVSCLQIFTWTFSLVTQYVREHVIFVFLVDTSALLIRLTDRLIYSTFLDLIFH